MYGEGGMVCTKMYDYVSTGRVKNWFFFFVFVINDLPLIKKTFK